MMAQQISRDEAFNHRVAEGSEIAFCRDMIKAELPDRANLVIRTPDLSFAAQLELNLGGVHCLVKHVGGDHASDATIIYVPEDSCSSWATVSIRICTTDPGIIQTKSCSHCSMKLPAMMRIASSGRTVMPQ